MTRVRAWTLGVLLLAANSLAHAGGGTVPAGRQSVAVRASAYAEVVSAADTRVRAAMPGVVSDLEALPGDSVAAGAVLARLGGAGVDARMAQRKAAVQSAQAALEAARKTLAAERQKRSQQLSTRSTVYQAEADLGDARARLDEASARLAELRAWTEIDAPMGATVASVEVANGERVEAGQLLLTLRADSRLWLRATFHGADAAAVEPGMTGEFVPAGGTGSVAVRVRGIVGRVRPNGGKVVALTATAAAPGWSSGEAGTVTLRGAAREVVTVPTRALVLDRGQWWVLVSEPDGEHRRRVVPGRQVDDATVILHGLQAGDPVVVADPYLRFHADFATQYQAPD